MLREQRHGPRCRISGWAGFPRPTLAKLHVRRRNLAGLHPKQFLQDKRKLGRAFAIWGLGEYIMRNKDLIAPLAAGLSQVIWTQTIIADHLKNRLPPRQRAMALPIAAALLRTFPGRTAPDAKRIAATLLALPRVQTLLAYARKHAIRPLHILAPSSFEPNPALPTLPVLHGTDDLADWLVLSPDQLIRFADLRGLSAHSPDRFGQHYQHHLIPKQNGNLRLIEEPKPFLKRLQRDLLQRLINHIPPHPAAYGFCRGRNCITAAARHAGEAVVISFDLADFFANIGFRRVYALFRSLGYPAATARDLSGLCTALTPQNVLATPNLAAKDALKHRHLPQGASTSPAIANLIALALDRRLTGLAHSLNATYTRYADDLTFSGDARIANILMRAVPEITRDEGFALNPAKTRHGRAHQRQITTGIVVNQTAALPRKTYDRLKATLHHLANPADPRRTDPGFMARLHGQISWAEQVNPARAARLRTAYDTLTN